MGGGGTSDKTDFFSTRTKNKVEKRISFFLSDMKFCFMKQLFPRPR
jgi:hypothetical protein